MKILSVTSRVTFGLVCLSVSVWLLAVTLGMIPNRRDAIVQGRAALCENLAVHSSLMASNKNEESIEIILNSLVQRNASVQSAAVRRPDGSLLAQSGKHVEHWTLPPGKRSSESQMRVPILAGEKEWGTVEVRFRELQSAGILGWLQHPLVALLAFVASASFVIYYLYLTRMFKHLDPSKVIPSRVRATLDTLAEGMLVLDTDERIVLANRSFAETVGSTASELVGRKASELPWEQDDEEQEDGYPWTRAISDGLPHIGEMLSLGHEESERIFRVSASPIVSDKGQNRGALASFDDVTKLERNRAELRQMLDALSKSRDEIHRQNLELERMATRDPLTSCLNRRAFFNELETLWSAADRYGHPIACLMLDLDHFKMINDTHGHSTGDMVLQRAAELLHADRRNSDLVCRYGGEEFCVLLPFTDITDAHEVAEKMRATIESTSFDGISVTSSIGVSARGLGAEDPQQLIDQADQCLYVAKRTGRNQAVRFDEAADQICEFEKNSPVIESRADGRDCATPQEGRDPAIPFHAVTALVSALAYRDPSTAEHSRRVADLCVETARGLMSVGESYILEIAALLHDIGKIGVPDSILLKPGQLSDEEWKVMGMHDRAGVEIVQSTFSSSKLAEVVGTHHAWFSGNPRHPELPTGEEIPLAARILAIADAYDAMTNDRVYRKAMGRTQAFVELRRCAANQFDPELVERFIDTVISREGTEVPAVPDTSKAAALGFGTQIERLAEALEKQDIRGMAALARRLNMTATKYEVAEIALVASNLEEAAQSDAETKQLVELTSELLDLCRSAQRAYLSQCQSPATNHQREAEAGAGAGAAHDQSATAVFAAAHETEKELV